MMNDDYVEEEACLLKISASACWWRLSLAPWCWPQAGSADYGFSL